MTREPKRSIVGERAVDLVPRSRFGVQTVHDGDRLEIVVAVGGGGAAAGPSLG